MTSICSKCRAENPQDSEFCGSCGTALSITQTKMISFPDAIKLGFLRAFDFRSRSTRAEYWWWVLFTVLVGIIFTVVDFTVPAMMLIGLFRLAVLIPGLALGARRLHDINKSGWWQLLWVVFFLIIPVISLIWWQSSWQLLWSVLSTLALVVFFLIIPVIILLWWATKPSDEGTNKYGPPQQQATLQ
jgi:uncharacterized membrane protein YhaH (DUF805 family)